MLPGLKEQDPRGSGEGVPTDLRGELTESQLRKSKNLAKRRLQKVRTKSKKRKRQKAEPSESDKFSEKATAESPYEKQKEEAKLGRTLRKRHFAECCESDKDGSKTAPTFSNLKIFVKNRQHFFAIELMNFINSTAKKSNFAIVSANF